MIRPLFDRWIWRMAWRDSRRGRGRLLLYVTALCVGVAALVAIGSFGRNVQQALADEAKGLLGADYRLSSRNGFDAATEDLIARAAGQPGVQVARQEHFPSMAYFPGTGASRLVQVRATAGAYPFYGALETDPPAAERVLREGGAGALVDEGLLLSSGAGVGDLVRIGSVEYPIAGALRRIPGEAATASLFGPRVYIPRAGLDEDLLAQGSRSTSVAYFAFPTGDAEAEAHRLEFEAEADAMAEASDDLRFSTVESTEERWSERMEDLRGFLQLVGFVALLLGGLGVGAAMAVWARRKVPSVATLRCLGAEADRAFAVFLAQALLLAAVGSLVGAALGVAVQRFLPGLVGDALPVDLEPRIEPLAILLGVVTGISFALLFALVPLLPLRRVAPLLALRQSDPDALRRSDPLRALTLGVLLLLVVLFAYVQTGDWEDALAYTAGLSGALLVLFALAKALLLGARRAASRRLPYEWRQGVANLHRPHNQTTLLLVAIGLGAFLVLTMYQVRGVLLAQLDLATRGEQPNLVMFDVQDDQLDDLKRTLTDQGLPVLDSVPIVTMRIAAVKGATLEQMASEGGRGRPHWAVRREYRSTYRDRVMPYEKLVAGEFQGHAGDPQGLVPVSMETRQAERLGVGLGDTIDWDVQGVVVRSVVTSLREVDWVQFRANFFAVFPTGVLEDAPKFHVVTTRADEAEARAAAQRAVVERFPNVSVIDVTLVEQVAEDLFTRIALVIRFLAGFSVITGLIVLIGSVLTTRFQRVEESALLRTLGATRKQVERIAAVEYLALGSLATLTGAILSVGATWMLARFRFDLPFDPAWLPLSVAFLVIVAATSAVGRFAGIGLHQRPPLEVLRAEG